MMIITSIVTVLALTALYDGIGRFTAYMIDLSIDRQIKKERGL